MKDRRASRGGRDLISKISFVAEFDGTRRDIDSLLGLKQVGTVTLQVQIALGLAEVLCNATKR